MHMRRPFWQRLVDGLFGFDFFISYAQRDGHFYASLLARRLEQKYRFTCFLDRKDYGAGDDWKRIGTWALRRTSRLVLVGTTAALNSKPVQREVKIFKSSGRKVIPIDFDGSLSSKSNADSVTLRLIGDAALRLAESNSRLQSGPSEAILEKLSETFSETRQAIKRQRWLQGFSALLTVLLALVVWQYIRAEQEAAEARHQARISKAREMAALADRSMRRSPYQAAKLALAGLNQLERSDAPAALVTTLWQSLDHCGGFSLYPQVGTNSMLAFSPDERWLVQTVGAEKLFLWELGNKSATPVFKGCIDVNAEILCLQFVSTENLEVGTRRGGVSVNLASTPPDAICWPDTGKSVTAIHAVAGRDYYLVEEEAGLTLRRLPGGHFGSRIDEPEVRRVIMAEEFPGCFVRTPQGLVRWEFTGTGPIREEVATTNAVVPRIAADRHGRSVAYADTETVYVVSRQKTGRWAEEYRAPLKLVSSFGWRDDGKLLAAASTAGLLLYPRCEGERPRFIPEAHHGWVMTAGFFRGSDRLITTGVDGTVRFWNTNIPGQPPAVFTEHDEQANVLRFAEDGQTAVSASTDASLVVWRGEKDLLGDHVRLAYDGDELTSFAVSAHGHWAASTSPGTGGRLWDLRLPKPASALAFSTTDGNGGGSATLAVDKRSGLVAAAGTDGTISLLTPETSQVLTLSGHSSGFIDNMSFSPGGGWLLTDDSEEFTRAWSLDGRKTHRRLSLDTKSEGVDFGFSAKAGRVFVSTVQGLAVWNLEEEKTEPKWQAAPLVSPLEDGTVEIVCEGARIYRVNQRFEGGVLRLITQLKGVVVAVDLDGERVIAEPRPGEIEVWRIRGTDVSRTHHLALSHGPRTPKPLPQNPVYGPSLIAIKDNRDLLLLKPLANGEWRQQVVKSYEQEIQSLSHFPNGKHVVVHLGNGQAEVWRLDPNQQSAIQLPVRFGSTVTDISLLSDGVLLVQETKTNRQASVILLKERPSDPIPLPVFDSALKKPFVTDDGRFLIVGYEDGAIRCFPLRPAECGTRLAEKLDGQSFKLPPEAKVQWPSGG